MKRHKIKRERPEGSSGSKAPKDADLTYYINDRVELLHQVFSLLKPREIKAMMPNSLKGLSMDDLQELCLEELLGISSKRLLAVLNGAPPPSDTGSSSDGSRRHRGAGNLDSVSLDSISSDEGALSNEQGSQKSKKHKRCKRRKKRKRGDKSRADAVARADVVADAVASAVTGAVAGAEATGERERAAERAGLTVLELLELQARARAIRAQLNAEVARNNTPASASLGAAPPSDDDVEIKEEPPEVVELVSSDDEAKPDLALLQAAGTSTNPLAAESCTTIIVPKTQPTKKIKLIRPKPAPVSTASNADSGASLNTAVPSTTQSTNDDPEKGAKQPKRVAGTKAKDHPMKKDRVKKRKKAKRAKDTDGSDQDEITLQLSDSEKMDLLEDFDSKSYGRFSSSSSEDVSEDSNDSSPSGSTKQVSFNPNNPTTNKNVENITVVNENNDNNSGENNQSKNVDNSLVAQKIDENAVNVDHHVSDSKVDSEQTEQEVPAEELAAPKPNEVNDKKVGKCLESESEVVTVVENEQENSETVDENTTDAQKLVGVSAEEQRRPDDVTESTISTVVDGDIGDKLAENSERLITLEEENKSTASVVEASNSKSEPDQGLTSDINGTADKIDASDVETTKKPNSKKKSKKKEKKSKKDKSPKD